MRKKYFTEEERKAAKRERDNLRYQRLKDNEEFKAAHRAQQAKHYKENRDKIRARQAEHYQQNRNEILAKQADYYSTPIGRANCLLRAYRRADKAKNRGNCTLTVEFILEHIFTQPCAHCGETDWRKIGCNRLDNNLPHTPDNVEPCCWECNERLGNEWKKELFSKPVYQYTLDGLLVAIWPSTKECGRNGFDQSAVAKCCRGKAKAYKGFKWSYEPLQKQVSELELIFE